MYSSASVAVKQCAFNLGHIVQRPENGCERQDVSQKRWNLPAKNYSQRWWTFQMLSPVQLHHTAWLWYNCAGWGWSTKCSATKALLGVHTKLVLQVLWPSKFLIQQESQCQIYQCECPGSGSKSFFPNFGVRRGRRKGRAALQVSLCILPLFWIAFVFIVWQ